jgi:hypothetical protein
MHRNKKHKHTNILNAQDSTCKCFQQYVQRFYSTNTLHHLLCMPRCMHPRHEGCQQASSQTHNAQESSMQISFTSTCGTFAAPVHRCNALLWKVQRGAQLHSWRPAKNKPTGIQSSTVCNGSNQKLKDGNKVRACTQSCELNAKCSVTILFSQTGRPRQPDT